MRFERFPRLRLTMELPFPGFINFAKGPGISSTKAKAIEREVSLTPS